MTKNRQIAAILIVGATALAGGGCAMSAAEVKNLKLPEQIKWAESRFVRGRVTYAIGLLSTNTKISGMETKGFHLTPITFFRGIGGYEGFESVNIRVPEVLKLEMDDIVDIYLGASYYDAVDDDEIFLSLPEEQRSQVLGVVCRDDEEGCDADSTPQTTLGYGRKMRGAHEYQGVAAEAKQRIYPSEIDNGIFFKPGSTYASKGLAVDYEDPPEEQQQPYPKECNGSFMKGYWGCPFGARGE